MVFLLYEDIYMAKHDCYTLCRGICEFLSFYKLFLLLSISNVDYLLCLVQYFNLMVIIFFKLEISSQCGQ